MNKKIVVLGCARSGTMYISNVFQKLGIDIRHEKMGIDGTSDWHKVPSDLSEFDCVLHQVRHPLKVISSMTTAPPSTWKSINKHIPLILDNELIDGMRYWYFWNLMIEPYSNIRYRVENIKSEWNLILEILNIPYTDLPNVSNKINSRPHEVYTWNDLENMDKNLCDKIKRLSRNFGYED